MSGSSVFQTTTESDFYKLIIQRIYLGIWGTISCLHSIKKLYGSFRQLFTTFLLMNGLKEEHIKDIFKDIGRITSQEFESKQFIELYSKTIGYFENYNSKHLFNQFLEQYNYVYNNQLLSLDQKMISLSVK
ncbi:hypothetical protein SS50377_23418 [Spironucleus salmonicida]|uniref:Uncharacterized protein n=1 Tax=Spironucleus salmonicida TaxID=348837 RepID=V6LZA1_9EUKA|nr:hypothetical protein SS50377_23418 [Spironucleus salmonicida]|eukprot:EST46154.1 Hypothetical protein SS50377_13746 [Spironucleus salmonicida]